MSSYTVESARATPGASAAARPAGATDRPPTLGAGHSLRVFTPPPEQPPPDGRLGYHFDPIPEGFRCEIADRWMPPSASNVLAVYMRYARLAADSGKGDGASCWASLKTVGRETGLCPRQVRNVRKTIIARRWMRREKLDGPDPFDPRNRTGERWVMPFMAGQHPAPEPAEVPPAKPRRGRPPGRGGKFISSPPQAAPAGPESTPGPVMDFPETRQSISPKRDSNSSAEPTFNVAAPARWGEVADPASVATAAPGPDDPPPTPAPTPAPAHRPPTEEEADWLRIGGCTARQAVEKLQLKLLDERIVLKAGNGDMILWEPAPGARRFPPEAVYWMGRLKPHLLAMLRPDPAPDGPAADIGGIPDGPPAPKVRDSAKVRALLGGLPRNPDPEAARIAQRALSRALGDDKPESVTTFHGLAGDVQRDGLAVDCLVYGFDEACKPAKRNRGATFINAVERWKSWQAGRGRSPSPEVRP